MMALAFFAILLALANQHCVGRWTVGPCRYKFKSHNSDGVHWAAPRTKPRAVRLWPRPFARSMSLKHAVAGIRAHRRALRFFGLANRLARAHFSAAFFFAEVFFVLSIRALAQLLHGVDTDDRHGDFANGIGNERGRD